MPTPDEFEIPDEWGLSEQQEVVIGSLIDARGSYIPAADFCNALYPDDQTYRPRAPSPAKLRVLIQRCRSIVADLTNDRAGIQTKRGKGWRVIKTERVILMKASGD